VATESPTRGSIMGQPRWRAAVLLGGMGNAIASILPLFALVALDQPVQVAAGAVAAYTLGTLGANLLVWGRLADRVRYPRALVVAGTAARGVLMLGVAVFPQAAGILALSLVLGASAVSADGALVRLVAGGLDRASRAAAMFTYSHLGQRGVLLGLAATSVALPLLRTSVDEVLALRIAVGGLGVVVLVQAAIALSTVGFERAAPRLSEALFDLGRSGVMVLWSGAAGPVQRVLRTGAPRRAAGLPDSLRLMFASLAVLHLGFAVHSGVFAVYLRGEAGLSNALVVGVLLGGAVMTDFTISRVGRWLETIPAVQVQVAASALRAAIFLLFGLLAFAPAEAWSLAGVTLLYLLGQMCWGGIVPAHARRLADLAPESRRAEVMALHGAATGAGGVLGAALAGAVAAGLGFPITFALAAVLTVLGAVLLLRW
jgi:hypothetical protein